MKNKTAQDYIEEHEEREVINMQLNGIVSHLKDLEALEFEKLDRVYWGLSDVSDIMGKNPSDRGKIPVYNLGNLKTFVRREKVAVCKEIDRLKGQLKDLV